MGYGWNSKGCKTPYPLLFDVRETEQEEVLILYTMEFNSVVVTTLASNHIQMISIELVWALFF